MSNRFSVALSEQGVFINVGSYIDENTNLVVHNPILLQGAWDPNAEPKNQETILWQDQAFWIATGTRPTGVVGQIRFSIGDEPNQTGLTFKNDGTGVEATFDGNSAPYTGSWNGQKVTLNASLQGNTYQIQLLIGNFQP